MIAPRSADLVCTAHYHHDHDTMTHQLSRIFQFKSLSKTLMLFTVLVWISAIALAISWPWKKSNQWQADFPLVGACAPQLPCLMAYGDLDKLKAEGKLISLQPPKANGELSDTPEIWVQWSSPSNVAWQYEVKRSSWNFETKVRYRLEGETPVLVQYRKLDGQIVILALPMAAFMLLGLRLRQLRSPKS